MKRKPAGETTRRETNEWGKGWRAHSGRGGGRARARGAGSGEQVAAAARASARAPRERPPLDIALHRTWINFITPWSLKKKPSNSLRPLAKAI